MTTTTAQTATSPRNHKVLVANRGEIACRILRGARELGLPTVAIYSEADAGAVHVTLADEAVCVGPAASAESYLRIDAILDAARQTGATIIHPGYGFLSEKAEFRDACDAAGLRFAGPPGDAMRRMGVKTVARQTMMAAGVPVVPGTTEGVRSAEDAIQVAAEIGYPVMLKAASGGGGKGMRLVERAEDIAAALAGAQREAAASFADDTVYIEKFVVRPRHIEVQILADGHGSCIHVFDRECSVQRRNQKVIEESPAPHLSDATRQKMGAVAVAAARAVNYQGAGTIEFLVDPDENFYFMEMNTRLQVEHPVTELVTGVDLVIEMLRVAMGEALSVRQDDVYQRGHAIECRIYAEDPAQNFMPSPGHLEVYRPAKGPGVRVDDGVVEGSEIPRYYDPMIAKLSTWAPDRSLCIARMEQALAATEIGGIRHNVDYLRWLLAAPSFVDGRYDTGLIASLGAYGQHRAADPLTAVLATALTARRLRGQVSAPPDGRSPDPSRPTQPQTPPVAGGAWARAARDTARFLAGHERKEIAMASTWIAKDLDPNADVVEQRVVLLQDDGARIVAEVDGVRIEIDLRTLADGRIEARSGGGRRLLRARDLGHALLLVEGSKQHVYEISDERARWLRHAGAGQGGGGEVKASMPGRVVRLPLALGSIVAQGDVVAVLEAMKMENDVKAPIAGVLSEIAVAEGDAVEARALLLRITPEPQDA